MAQPPQLRPRSPLQTQRLTTLIILLVASCLPPARVLAQAQGRMPGARCLCSGICDGDEVAPQHVPARLLHAKPSHDRLKSRFWSGACGSDGLGCVTEPSERRQRIREAARSSWRAYKRYAWGADQLAPLSRSGAPCPWVPYNAGMSLLDAADTLWLLGLDKEYAEARTWLARHMTPAAFGSPAWDFNADTFTLSMTFLGSLLSLADLTGDGMYAAAAAELGSRLQRSAFDTSPSGWPWRNVNVARVAQGSAADSTNVGEAASPSLEFERLAAVTGDARFSAAGRALWLALEQAPEGPVVFHGLVPVWWNVTTGTYIPVPQPHNGSAPYYGPWWATVGGMGDLAYEYMLKTWVLSGGKDELPLRLYKRAMVGLRTQLLTRTASGRAWLSVLWRDPATGVTHRARRMEHLACFVPGLLTLGHLNGINTATGPGQPSDLQLAQDLAATCYDFYRMSPTGLNPHDVEWLPGDGPPPTAAQKPPATAEPSHHNTSARMAPPHAQQQPRCARPSGGAVIGAAGAAYYDQQPELLESLMYLYRVTGNVTYREWGWSIFRATQLWTRLPDGSHCGLQEATEWPRPKCADVMWDWWLAETLKYSWLLHSEPDVLDLKEWVFNTEGHTYRVNGGIAAGHHHRHHQRATTSAAGAQSHPAS